MHSSSTDAFKVKTKGGRVIGEKEPRWVGQASHIRDGDDDQSTSAFESYVMASKRDKDVLREKLKEVTAERDKTGRQLDEARSRLSFAEGRNAKLEADIKTARSQCTAMEDQQRITQNEERRLKNLVEMLKEENNLQKGQMYSLLEFQKAQSKKIEELKSEVIEESTKSLLRDDRKGPSLSIEDLSCECPVCMDNFDDKKVIPVVWHCGHMVCEACTDKLSNCPTCLDDKQYVSAKCIDYLRLIELLQRMTKKHSPEESGEPDRID